MAPDGMARGGEQFSLTLDGILHSSMPEMSSGMGEGQNVPAPTVGFSIQRTAIFQMRASFRLAFVTV
jgi:hypothetical protein